MPFCVSANCIPGKCKICLFANDISCRKTEKLICAAMKSGTWTMACCRLVEKKHLVFLLLKNVTVVFLRLFAFICFLM